MDLRKLIDFHNKKGADVTIALNRSSKPLEYGLVMTDAEGRVEQFIEKPSRDRVYTDHVNTGIYVISNHILEEIPDNTPYDFARDLFPKLMAQGRKLCGLLIDGYWCDVGSCLSYLKANFDALSGSLRLHTAAAEHQNKIWTKSELNEQAVFKPPCYIGEGVKIGNGAVIGPFTVIGSGSSIGAGTLVRGSVVDGAVIDEKCRLSGSIVCRGARIGSGTQLLEGCVVGEAAALGSGCMVSEGVRIWPDKQVPAGTKLKYSLISGMPRTGPIFEVRGIVSGEPGIEITPELCLSMGSAVGRKDVGVACSGGEYARILADCFACGASSSGGNVFRLDAPVAATASFASRLYRLPLTMFAEQKGKTVTLRFFNDKGLPINRETERKFENASAADISMADPEDAGTLTTITGAAPAHYAAASACCLPFISSGDKSMRKQDIRFAVSGRCTASRLLRSALAAAGFTVRQTEADLSSLELSSDGFSLTVRDENGMVWDGKLLTALALVEFEHGEGKVVLPYFAPAAADVLSSKLGGKVYRLDRDGAEAENELLLHPYASDGLFLAVRLVSALHWYGGSFSELRARIPSFFTARREMKMNFDRGRLMRELAASLRVCRGACLRP
jgi:mannose-1-phosphate guanylyltransferase/phosphomannomutase